MDAAGVQQAGEQDAQCVVLLEIELVADGGTGERLDVENLMGHLVEADFQNAVIVFVGAFRFVRRERVNLAFDAADDLALSRYGV